MRKHLKTLFLLLTTLALLCCFSSCLGEAGTTDYTYAFLPDGTTEVQGYTGNDTEPEIPSELEGRKVTAIGNYAFSNCSNLTGITIPKNVTNFEEGMFERCYDLADITIPDSVTSIGDYAFSYCRNLTAVTIPDSVINIGEEAFSNSSNLTSITIPNSVTSIGNDAFSGCSSLKLTVGHDSYAEEYCRGKGLKYTYPDAND